MFTISTTMIMNRVLIKDIAYDAEKDFTLVSIMPAGSLPFVAAEKIGAKTLAEFVAYVKKAEKVNIGTYGATDVDGTITQGGYAMAVVVNEDFVVNIPAALDLEFAAPLLCAGITTYSPLRRWGAGPGKKVAVIGLGGLGHMAVKIAHAMGAEVTVLSRTLVNVGAPAEPLPVNVFSLISGRRSFAGSMIGGIRETQEMLDFCAEHRIAAEVEVIAAQDINKAYERVLASDVHYRFVIDTATLA